MDLENTMKQALGSSAEKQGEQLTPDGGVRKELTQAAPEGAESPPDGATVSVHYDGYLELSGAEFDSSRRRGVPLEFKLGVGA